MNILNKLSLRNLVLNKKRTISTIIGIILSVALICAVSCMAASFRKTLVQNAINETGYFHLKISDITSKDVDELKNNRDIKDIYELSSIGYGFLDGCKNESKPFVKLYSMSDSTFNTLKFNLTSGRFPQNDSEIIISRHIITNGEIKLNVGDEITLGIGKRLTSDNEELNDYNPYLNGEEESDIAERLEVEFTKKYKIVGIIERPDYSFENYSCPAYTIITTGINTEKKDVYLSLKNPRGYKTSIPQILGVEDYSEVRGAMTTDYKYDNFDINDELLRWEVFAFSDSTISMMYSVIAVVMAIIIFTSVFCIRNSFAISITEKIKMYAMLSSIGAAKKQIKKNVIFEAMILSVIGMPIGILSGIFAVFVLIKIVNLIIGDMLLSHVDGLVFTVSITAIVISVLLGIITIYLSAISSARRASKVNPIDGLRNSNEIKLKSKSLKTPKIIEKIFKTGGVLSYKNLKRSKAKYRTTVISLTVSIFVFISMNAFITSAFDMSSNYYEDYEYNFIVGYSEDSSTTSVDSIVSHKSVKQYFTSYCISDHEYLKVTDLEKINKYGQELSKEYILDSDGNAIESGRRYSDINIIGLDDTTFRKYCKKIGVNYDKVKNKCILIDNYNYYDEEKNSMKEIRRYNYDEKDTIYRKFG